MSTFHVWLICMACIAGLAIWRFRVKVATYRGQLGQLDDAERALIRLMLDGQRFQDALRIPGRTTFTRWTPFGWEITRKELFAVKCASHVTPKAPKGSVGAISDAAERTPLESLERTGFVMRDPTTGRYTVHPSYTTLLPRLVREWRAGKLP